MDVLNTQRRLNHAVIISRLTSSKNIPESIHAFAKVVERIPTAKLDIFGSGEEQESVKALISELKLEENIFLKGYTKNPDLEFQQATLTMCTSKFEGFGLSNMEALSNGCPVVTYDYDYGAQTLVQDGINGYIVKPGSVQDLAEKIINIFKDEQLRDTLSRNAFQSAEQFVPSSFITYWSESLQSMITQSDRRKMLEKQYKNHMFTLTALEDSSYPVFKIELNQSVSEENTMSLVALDRTHKLECFNEPLKNSGGNLTFTSRVAHLEFNTILANDGDVIDFYVCISNSYGDKLYKRIEIDTSHFDELSFNTDFKVLPYQTKFKKYSWRVSKI